MALRLPNLWIAAALLPAACALETVDRADAPGFRPIEAMVLETDGLLPGGDGRSPVLVQVSRTQAYSELGRFEKSARIRLELGPDARVVGRVRGRGRSAATEDIRKGDRVRISGYDQVLLSDPAIIFSRPGS